MTNFFNWLYTNFGFNDSSDFMGSIIHKNLLLFTIPFTLISTLIENYLGLQSLTVVSFFILVILELVSGLIASKIKGIKIQSKKFGRFGFKLIAWLTLIFIVNSMRLQYKDSSVILTIFDWLHNSLFIYISIEYLISILENTSTITGEPTSPIVKGLKKKLNQWFDLDNKD